MDKQLNSVGPVPGFREFPATTIRSRSRRTAWLLATALLCLSKLASATEIVREDAEDGSSSRWTVVDNNPPGATIANLVDATLQSRVIELSGSGFNNAYRIGGTSSSNGWNDTIRHSVSWRFQTDERFSFYVAAETTNGFRYLQYDDRDVDRLLVNNLYVHHGLGSSSANGDWVFTSRNLEDDLADAEPGNTLIAVHGMIVRGNLRLDDLSFQQLEPDPSRSYEDAEDGESSRWTVVDNNPSGAAIDNILDPSRQSRVIELSGAGFANAYRIGGLNSNSGWNDTTRPIVSWRFRTGERFAFYVAAETSAGFRYFQYDNRDTDRLLINGLYVHHGLGSASTDGNWRTVTRNLADDLAAAEPGNTLIAVHGLLVRGDVWLDEVELHELAPPANVPPTANAGQDQTAPEGQSITLDGSQSSDSDGDILGYQWWDSDDNLIGNTAIVQWAPANIGGQSLTLIVFDDDGDQASDTTVVTVLPDDPTQIYEDGEDGETSRWTLVDNNPAGAAIDNVLDPSRQSRVIELSGAGFDNAFRMGGLNSNNGWNDTTRHVVSWRFRTSERFAFYVAAETAAGFRYFQYDNRDTDRLLINGLYVHHGLGSVSTDGNWRTITRDLVADLAAAEPGNSLIAVHGLLVRGNVWLDEVTLHELAPPANLPPIANAGPDQSSTEAQSITLDATQSSDPDGSVLQYEWVDNAGNSIGNTAIVQWTPTTIGSQFVNLTIFDDDGAHATDSTEVSVAPQNPVPNLADYELVFSDEFDGTALDPLKWQTGLLWGPYLQINAEEQLYVDTLGINAGFSYDPFSFNGDTLTITATPTSPTLQPPPRPPENDPIWDPYPEYRYNGPTADGPGYQPSDVNYLSGIITSYDQFRMTHGYVEARARVPEGHGLWPAFWLLNTHYVEDSPEIDVMEFLGRTPDKLYHTYHFFDISDNWRQISTPTFESDNPDWSQNFHTFGMAWSPNAIVWYVNGVEVHRIVDGQVINGETLRISRQAMYLIANLAMGGSWAMSPDSTTPFPAHYEIDYIRAYKKVLSEPVDLAADFQLVFEDDFDGPTLDPTKWNTRFLWGPYHIINNEEQYYVDTNGIDSGSAYSPFSFDDEAGTSFLTITADTSANSGSDLPPASLPPPNDPLWANNPEFQQGPYDTPQAYTSGLITSYDAFKFVNGYAEIRARIPAGDGLWPAFWLLNAYYVGPLPEIDIMEILGENPDRAYHTFHRSGSDGTQTATQFISDLGNAPGGYSDDFHTFGVHWKPGEITWYVDGAAVHTHTEPGDNNDAYQLMYVLANLAVGGNFNSVPLDPTALPARYDIDYIRVYQEIDTP